MIVLETCTLTHKDSACKFVLTIKHEILNPSLLWMSIYHMRKYAYWPSHLCIYLPFIISGLPQLFF